jgi:hypothetical protein
MDVIYALSKCAIIFIATENARTSFNLRAIHLVLIGLFVLIVHSRMEPSFTSWDCGVILSCAFGLTFCRVPVVVLGADSICQRSKLGNGSPL